MEAVENTKQNNRKLFLKQRTYARFCALQVLFQMDFDGKWAFTPEQWAHFARQTAELQDELQTYMPEDVQCCISEILPKLQEETEWRMTLNQLEAKHDAEAEEMKHSKRKTENEDAVTEQQLFDARMNWQHADQEAAAALANFLTFPSFDYAKKLIDGIAAEHERLDGEIQTAAKNWSLARMARLDRCLMRMSAFEILYMKDISPAIAIDQAIDLAKLFCQQDSPRFVNGVLDKLRKNNTAASQGNEGTPADGR